jgi:5'-nucleotidase
MRRPFTIATLALSAFVFADKPITITFLHTNDLHAHIMPTAIRGKTYGGYARLATLVRQTREKEKNVVLLNAGDTFQGTLYFNTYEGLADAALLTAIGIQAGTVGNHEFDRGPDVLATYAEAIGWPLVAANLDLSREPKLRGKIAKYVVLNVGGEKLGIVGADTPDAPNISSPGPNIEFRDVVPTVQAAVDELTSGGVNKIVVVTHIGYEEDQKMVSQLRDVDLVVGAHSHTPLGTPELPGWQKAAGPYPTLVRDLKGKEVPIVQAYEWGKVLGKIQIEFDGQGNVKRIKEAKPIVVDDSIPEDSRIRAMARAFEKPILAIQNAQVGTAAVAIGREPVGGDSLMADIMADAMQAATKSMGSVASFINQGGVRAGFESGKITYGQAVAVMPFNNTLTVLDVTGAELLAAIKQGIGTGGQLTPSAGTSYRVNGNDVQVTIAGMPLDPAKIYRITLLGFTASGGDSLFAFRDAKGRRIDTGLVDIDGFVEYLKANSPLNPKPEGRVVIQR